MKKITKQYNLKFNIGDKIWYCRYESNDHKNFKIKKGVISGIEIHSSNGINSIIYNFHSNRNRSDYNWAYGRTLFKTKKELYKWLIDSINKACKINKK